MISMTTPSGRFERNQHICTTFTSLHPEEWNPAWTVETILTGFLSFMTGEEHGAGCRRDSEDERKRMAKESRRWNSLECVKFRVDFQEEHDANLKSETFTVLEREKIKATDEVVKSETEGILEKKGDTMLDNSYESHVNEDWEQFGSMEEDDFYEEEEEEEEDEDEDEDEDEEMEDEEMEDYETSDTEMDDREKK